MPIKCQCDFVTKIPMLNNSLAVIISVLAILLISIRTGNGVRYHSSSSHIKDEFYFPKDSSYNAKLNSIRCVNYKGHLSGKSRWPYTCLLPASHLATGRVFDGTSKIPDAIIAPPWINLTLFEEGQRFARDNSGHLLLSHIYGIFCTNLFLDSKELLLFSGGFDSPERASRRYIRIANEIFNWYRNAPSATDFPSFEEVARGIRNVRRVHRNVTLRAEKFLLKKHRRSLITPSVFKSRSVNGELWKTFMKDVGNSPIPYQNRRFPVEYSLTQEYRLPLNQFIQAITQFGFVGFPVLFPERVGLTSASDEELFAFNHLWAVLAYCVGIKDEYNIGLQPDLYTTRKYFRDIFETFIQPAFFQVDFFAKILLDSLLEAVNSMEATMTPRVTMTRILRDVLKIPVPSVTSRLNAFEKMTLAVTDPVLNNNRDLNQKLVSIIGENILGAGAYYDKIVEDSPPTTTTEMPTTNYKLADQLAD